MKDHALSNDIYKVLAAPSYNYDISMYDSDGNGTISPFNAKWFYVNPVSFMIQVPDDEEALLRREVYLWKSLEIEDEQSSEVLKRLKTVANQYGYGFTIYDFGNGNLPKKFSHIAMRSIEDKKVQESVMESNITGTSRRTYMQLPKSRMVVVHNNKVDENNRSARTKDIKEIFIENNGERKRFGNNNFHAAKAATYHLNEGGSWGDKVYKHIENSANDLDNLKTLISDLELNGKSSHLNKTKQFISELKSNLKTYGTPRGYSKMMESSTTIPRIGNKYIESYAGKLSPLSENKNCLMSYARQHLIRECANLPSYIQTISENVDDVEPRDLSNVAKRVCLGAVDCSGEFENPTINTPQELVLLANSLRDCVNDGTISSVLNNMLNKPYLSEQDAKLLLALTNSVLGCLKGNRQILVEPELAELTEWINKN